MKVEVLKPHLFLKRFASGDAKLTPGAQRSHNKIPEDVRAELAKTGRSVCHVCRDKIPKGSLRMCMFLQCHKGYKNAAFVHMDCFSKHPEASKVKTVSEVAGMKELTPADVKRVEAIFAQSRKRKGKQATAVKSEQSSDVKSEKSQSPRKRGRKKKTR